MTRAAIEDIVRAWLVAGGAQGGIPNPDRAVIVADEDATRPPLPYLLVRVASYDDPVHEDEDIVDNADPPTWRSRGCRTSTVSINAFGRAAEAWLERAHVMLRAPSIRTLLEDAGVAIRPLGPANNLSALLDERTQARVQQDFAVDYRRVAAEDDIEELIELEQIEHQDTFTGGGDDLVQTATVEL